MSVCKIVSYPSMEELSRENEVSGKFVQFRWRGVEYLLFATKVQHRFHNQMLGHFLEEHGLPHRWLGDETLEIAADDMEVSGGGRFRFVKAENLLELWDNSQAYGRFNESGIEAKIHAAAHPWSTARVRVS